MATQRKPAAERARNEGPIVMSYVTADNEEHRRVPDGVASLKVMDRAKGNSVTFNPAELPEGVQRKLLFLGASRLVHGRIATGYDAEEGDNAVESATEVWQDLLSGQLYAKVEGDWQRGRQVDPKPYIDAMARYRKYLNDKGVIDRKTGQVVAPLTDQQAKNMRLTITSSTREKRNEYLAEKFKASNQLLMKYLKEERDRAKKIIIPVKGEQIEVVDI